MHGGRFPKGAGARVSQPTLSEEISRYPLSER
jgi:hypothetical protein